MNNSDDLNTNPPHPSVQTPSRLRRLLKSGGCLVLGLVLSGCTVPHAVPGEETANNAKASTEKVTSAPGTEPSADAQAQSSPPYSLASRPYWSERNWNNPPAAVAVNKGSVTPYPGEPESGDGATAYGAGLKPPVDSSTVKKRDAGDDGDDSSTLVPGVLIGKGVASWYGGQFHGRLTANGERFDRGELTAAHRTLPFGSKVCVRNISTGTTVMVRINDRGPFEPGRVIDLSQAAARELGIQGLGLKQVELWKLDSGSDSCPDELVTADAGDDGDGTAVTSRMQVTPVSMSKSRRGQVSHKSTHKTTTKAATHKSRNAAIKVRR